MYISQTTRYPLWNPIKKIFSLLLWMDLQHFLTWMCVAVLLTRLRPWECVLERVYTVFFNAGRWDTSLTWSLFHLLQMCRLRFLPGQPVIKWVETSSLFCGHLRTSLRKAIYLWRWPTLGRAGGGCPGTGFLGFGLCSPFHSPTPCLTSLMTLAPTPKLAFLQWIRLRVSVYI